MNQNYEELLTVRVSAKILGFGITKTYEYINVGLTILWDGGTEMIKLESVKLGKLRRIPRSALNTFIADLIKHSKGEQLELPLDGGDNE